jgi:hypothetical protein
MASDLLRQGVVTAERLADGSVSEEDVRVLWQAVEAAVPFPYEYQHSLEYALSATLGPSESVNGVTAAAYAAIAVAYVATGDESYTEAFVAAKEGEQREQLRLLRDIIGNPFRPVTVDSAWLTSTVVALANGIYAERAFDRLPILADTLMDAGCDNDDVLNHCRGDDPHVRGCWVVDLLTGRS